MMLRSSRAAARSSFSAAVDRLLVARRAPGLEPLDLLGLGLRRHGEDGVGCAGVSGDGSLSTKRLTPTTVCSPRSIASTRRVFDSTSCCFM